MHRQILIVGAILAVAALYCDCDEFKPTECAKVRRLNVWLIIDLAVIKDTNYADMMRYIVLQLLIHTFTMRLELTLSYTTVQANFSYINHHDCLNDADHCLENAIKAAHRAANGRQNHPIAIARDFKYILSKVKVDRFPGYQLKDLLRSKFETICIIITDGIAKIDDNDKRECASQLAEMGNIKLGVILFIPNQGTDAEKLAVRANVEEGMKNCMKRFMVINEFPVARLEEAKNQTNSLPAFTDSLCKSLEKCQTNEERIICHRRKPGGPCEHERIVTITNNKTVNCPPTETLYFPCDYADPNCGDDSTELPAAGVVQKKSDRGYLFYIGGIVAAILLALIAVAAIALLLIRKKRQRSGEPPAPVVAPKEAPNANKDESMGPSPGAYLTADSSSTKESFKVDKGAKKGAKSLKGPKVKIIDMKSVTVGASLFDVPKSDRSRKSVAAPTSTKAKSARDVPRKQAKK